MGVVGIERLSWFHMNSKEFTKFSKVTYATRPLNLHFVVCFVRQMFSMASTQTGVTEIFTLLQ